MDGESDAYLYRDLEISCNSSSHVCFVLFFAVPCLIIFVLGVPIGSTIALGKALKANGFHDDTTLYRYAVLISGYSEKYWYWSLIVCARKFTMAVVTIALIPQGTKVQYLCAILILFVALATQVHFRPFVNSHLNFLEDIGLAILFISMYLGLLFFWESFDPLVLGFVGDLIIVLNCLFLLFLARELVLNWLHRNMISPVSKFTLRCERRWFFSILLLFITIPLLSIMFLIRLKKMFEHVFCVCRKRQQDYTIVLDEERKSTSNVIPGKKIYKNVNATKSNEAGLETEADENDSLLGTTVGAAVGLPLQQKDPED